MRKAALTSILTVFLAILIVALLSAPALAATAGFVKTDTTTMGTWLSVYGADGYFVSQDSNTKLPGYANVTFSGQANWTWAASTAASPALQKPENSGNRIAGTWFMWGSFTIDVNLTDGNAHQVALYALDWDSSVRAETINVRDAATGAVLVCLIALSLSVCADQEQLVASCEFDAIQTYPREKLPTGAHIGDYKQTCMKVHGYDWNLTDKRCHVTKIVERNPYCYTPNNWLDRLLYLIEEPEPSN